MGILDFFKNIIKGKEKEEKRQQKNQENADLIRKEISEELKRINVVVD